MHRIMRTVEDRKILELSEIQGLIFGVLGVFGLGHYVTVYYHNIGGLFMLHWGYVGQYKSEVLRCKDLFRLIYCEIFKFCNACLCGIKSSGWPSLFSIVLKGHWYLQTRM